MFVQRSECSKCGHNDVCKYKEQYKVFANEVEHITECLETEDIKNIFFALAECRRWTITTPQIQRTRELLNNVSPELEKLE